MKKYFIKPNYKKWHKNKSNKELRNKIKRKNIKYDPYKNRISPIKNSQKKDQNKKPIKSPICLSILRSPSETIETINFFKKMRNNRHVSIRNNIEFITLDLSRIVNIDFSTICVLKALIEEVKSRSINVRGNFPIDKTCKKIIVESGLLNLMSDMNGNEYKVSDKSELIFIQTGKRKLTREDNIRISETIKKSIKHLTGHNSHCSRLRNIILEICGNSIEWGGTKNRAWLLGVKYNSNDVIFTITDVGNGILNTINRKFNKIIKDLFRNSSDAEILYNAFIRQYGSSTNEENRNKGLPSIKKGFDDGLLLDLKVITNNVALHFSGSKNSITLTKGEGFQGTLYRWSITKDSLENLN